MRRGTGGQDGGRERGRDHSTAAAEPQLRTGTHRLPEDRGWLLPVVLSVTLLGHIPSNQVSGCETPENPVVPLKKEPWWVSEP